MPPLNKTLTFTSKDLGENVTLLLCFVPPIPHLFETYHPVAWRVTTLSARGGSFFDATCTNQLGCCIAQVNAGQFATAGNYTSIEVGEKSTLMVDSSIDPPAYWFTDPMPDSYPGIDDVRAINGTDETVDIGFGFITDVDTESEKINTMLMCPNVLPSRSASATFIPLIRAYVKLNYKEKQIIGPEITSVKPIWEADMRHLRLSTRIVVKRTGQGGYVGVQLTPTTSDGDDCIDVTENQEVGVPPWLSLESDTTSRLNQRVFAAELRFQLRELQFSTELGAPFIHIARALVDKGYGVKMIDKGENEVRIELQLRNGASFYAAERDVLEATTANAAELGAVKAAIKARGGAVEFLNLEGVGVSYEVEPASHGWFIGGSNGSESSHSS